MVSNVRQSDEDEKEATSLLDSLDEVEMSLQFWCSSSPNTQALRGWERLPVDEMSEWAREMVQQRSMGDKSMIF